MIELPIDNYVISPECEEREYTTCNTRRDGQALFSEPVMFQERPELSDAVNLRAPLTEYCLQNFLLKQYLVHVMV